MAQTKVTSPGITDSAITNVKIDTVAASKLTGALPAISGAALTNLPTETKPTITSISPSVITNASTAVIQSAPIVSQTNFISLAKETLTAKNILLKYLISSAVLKSVFII